MKKQSRKLPQFSKNSLFLIFLTSLVIGVGFGVFWEKKFLIKNPAPSSSVESIEKESVKIKSFCAAWKEKKFRDIYNCYAKAFYNLTLATNTDLAFKTIIHLQKSDLDAQRSCHLLAHGVGWATYEKDPKDWRDNIEKMDTRCSYGGIHGILERYGSLGEGVFDKNTIPTLCGKNPTVGCFHGLGHVLLVETSDDLTRAIELCKALPTDKNYRHFCLTGVYMERMIVPNLVEHGLATQERRDNWYLHLLEFEELCKSQSGENLVACWTELVHAASTKYNGDTGKVFEVCGRAPLQEAGNSCRRHAISEIVPKKKYDLENIKYMCELAPSTDPDFPKNCYTSIVTIAMTNLSQDKQKTVVDYCSSLNNEFKKDCFATISTQLVRSGVSPNYIASLCQDVSSEYQPVCLGKSGRINYQNDDVHSDEIPGS